MQPLINILIRVSRPELYKRCLQSIEEQTYPHINILTFPGYKTPGYEYNLFCNDLKNQVEDGWFFYLDDDDILSDSTVLEDIATHLTNSDQPVICQMLRNGRPKPADIYMDRRIITRGRIGMPCILLHTKHKHIADFVATEDADYRFIKAVSEKLNCKFVKRVVVDAGKRNFGNY